MDNRASSSYVVPPPPPSPDESILFRNGGGGRQTPIHHHQLHHSRYHQHPPPPPAAPRQFRLHRIYPTAYYNGYYSRTSPPSADWSYVYNKERLATAAAATPTNVRLLRAINERAASVERLLFYLKLIGIVQVVLGLVLLGLDWAKLLLVWEYVEMFDSKLALTFRGVYSMLVLMIGSLTLMTTLVTTRGRIQLLLMCTCALLINQLCLPAQSAFLTNLIESMQIGRAKDSLRWTDPELSDTAAQMIQSALHNRLIKYLHSETLRHSVAHPLGIGDLSAMPGAHLLSLQYVLMTSSAICLFHSLTASVVLLVGYRLLQLQYD